MTISEERLRECPFCTLPDIKAERRSRVGWYCVCVSCCSQGPTNATKEEAITSWNLRSDAHTNGEVKPRPLVDELTGALRFILAFYDPGQTYLDTNAWKVAEAGGRNALAKGEAFLAAQAAQAAEAEALSLGHQGGAEPVAWTTQAMLDAMHEPDVICGTIWPKAAERANIPLFASPQPPTPAGVREITEEQAAAMREALQWYAETVQNCRKLSGIPEGEGARKALDKDGGIRARYALGVGATFKHGMGLRSTPEQTAAALAAAKEAGE